MANGNYEEMFRTFGRGFDGLDQEVKDLDKEVRNLDKKVDSLVNDVKNLDTKVNLLDTNLKEVDNKVDQLTLNITNLTGELKSVGDKILIRLGTLVVGAIVVLGFLLTIKEQRTTALPDQSAVIQQTVREVLKNRSIEKIVQEAIRKELLAIQSQDNSALPLETKTDSKPTP